MYVQNHSGGPERGHIALFGQSDTICSYRTHTVGGGVTCRWRPVARYYNAVLHRVVYVYACASVCAYKYIQRGPTTTTGAPVGVGE